MDELKLLSLFDGKYDDASSVKVSISAGAGGTEACDWVQMLDRMIMMYVVKKGWRASEVEVRGLRNCAPFGAKSQTPVSKAIHHITHSFASSLRLS